MKTSERHKVILQIINQRNEVTVSDLAEALDVSESTIRRDLLELESEQLLRRTHGKALSTKTMDTVLNRSGFQDRMVSFINEKKAIARYAASLVEDGDTVFIDGGTTCSLIARHLNTRVGLTVVTNSIKVAADLADSQGIEVFVTGGFLRSDTLSLSGFRSNDYLDCFHINKMFFGASGVTIEEGATAQKIGESQLRQKVAEQSDKVYLLVDHSKIGHEALCQVLPLKDIDVLITDEGLSPKHKDTLTAVGLEVVTVKVDPS